MSTPYTRWILAGCWIAVAVVAFIAMNASSARSWLYLATIALGPPIALLRLWPQPAPQTVAQMMRGRGDQS